MSSGIGGGGNFVEDPARVIQAVAMGRGLVEITHHASDRMEERDISDEDVILTLQNPDQVGLDADPPNRRVRRALPGRPLVLDVVFEERPDRIRVITTYAKKPRLSGRY
jgi:hypothetical protein